MALKLLAAPVDTAKIVQDAVRRSQLQKSRSLMALSGGSGVVAPTAPHMVFTILPEFIASPQPLANAIAIGWRTMVIQGSHAVAAVEYAEGGSASNFKSLNEGPFVKSTASAFKIAEGLPEVSGQDFEPRLLQLPYVYLMALWLHGATDDLLIPLEPAPSGIRELQVYKPEEFFQSVGSLYMRQEGVSNKPQ